MCVKFLHIIAYIAFGFLHLDGKIKMIVKEMCNLGKVIFKCLETFSAFDCWLNAAITCIQCIFFKRIHYEI